MPGPFERIDLGGGRKADLYLLRYREDGALLSPHAEQSIKDSLAGVTDIFVFSHGWNSTFDGALGHYRDFIRGYAAQGGGPAANAKPLLIGVIWPSISFVMPWERGPQIAAGGDDGDIEEMRRYVTTGLDVDSEARLSELVDGRTEITLPEAREAAEILRKARFTDADPEDGAPPPTVDELLEAWALLDGGQAARPAAPGAFGDIGGPAAAPGATQAAAPQAAGLEVLDPRNLLRAGTLWTMKDRAGKVGARGVGPLVRHLLARSDIPVHLIGHSFGGRVMLSALAAEPVARPATSLLLLQPAVNRWCFARDVVGTGRVGGYQSVLRRVRPPILSTFSRHDLPLHEVFHLVVRGSSLGEPDIAAVGDTDRYGALGGYGPAGLGPLTVTLPAEAPGAGRYTVADAVRVVAVDGGVDVGGGPAIGGHSEINNPVTWWALRCLTQRP